MTSSTPQQVRTPQTLWREWLVDKALPLWREAGFDTKRRLFHERLDWQAGPVRLGALRLMVQARQIATYCRATIDTLHDGMDQALTCLDTVEALYHRGDGSAGWVFSVNPEGRPASTKRDLYAHAFILFAYGWAIRMADRPEDRKMARLIAEEIDLIFTAPNEGYLDSIPDSGTLRSQNPHMHLLEAYLAVFEATGDAFYLERARKLIDLARTRLIDRSSGLLLEFFDYRWTPLKAGGQNQVQPGHLFEWSWLLRDYARLSRCDEADRSWLLETAEGLFRAGFVSGCDMSTSRVYDSMTENRVITGHASRIWAQTELLRLLHGAPYSMTHGNEADRFAHGFLERFAPERLNGGWIDHIDANGEPLVDYMPASSFYHIYGAGRQIVLK
ncbi:AGE family epimerase/isomerase [Swaminathania salitolerans]|uniref:Mannose-6-phosphate isomerase n=1 Tax=Swaminathania salitolerans TaxID=182838 RepID=A0A511BSR8_9PROT|nr:AGE family epimerase/isomerase [Swaminathania salitolerans]GBQ13075.1 mannose-6-phosphate isomerase [Swaminathania salitolerans LMG 21291]GEL03325.1 mannose-6-phosphate isomerase [Swaminathania salitolerans]